MLWGFFPLYFHRLAAVPAMEVLCHRLIWSALLCVILLTLNGMLPALLQVFRTPGILLRLLASGVLVSVNWGSYIWAVEHGATLDASMGYYILPLVSLGLGVLLLGEKLNRRQTFAILVVVLAVGLLTIHRGRLPWVVVLLPISFGLYGLVRKLVAVDPLIGVTVETLLCSPAALVYLACQPHPEGVMGGSAGTALLLILCGPVTTIPLVLFAFAARRITLSRLGLLQYITPSLQMLVSVLFLGEALGIDRLAAQALIWLGLIIYLSPWPADAG